jgi:hypothetical protein
MPNANPSMPASSANSSDAIFFTSEFKQFYDRQPSSPGKEEHQVEVIKEVPAEQSPTQK